MEIQTKFYHSDDVQDKIQITKIERICIDLDETAEYGIKVDVLNADGKSINTYYTVSEETRDDVRNYGFIWEKNG